MEEDKVTISSKYNGQNFGPLSLSTADGYNWSMSVSFDYDGIYEVTIDAYGFDGEHTNSTFDVTVI